MSDSKSTVQALARVLELPIPENRVDQLAVAWKEALAEAESVRQTPMPWPAAPAYDASWSEKK